jgi:hypothetical protein
VVRARQSVGSKERLQLGPRRCAQCGGLCLRGGLPRPHGEYVGELDGLPWRGCRQSRARGRRRLPDGIEWNGGTTVWSGMQIITPETLEALALALTSLPVGKSVYVYRERFQKADGRRPYQLCRRRAVYDRKHLSPNQLYRLDYGQARDFH